MGFQIEYNNWIQDHLRRRKGERHDALKRSNSFGNRLFAEKIWWPLVGNFNNLHPEYEVKDWRGRPYYADFLWKKQAVRIVFEVMDFGSHGTDRSKYRQDLNRGLFLQSQDYLLYSISLDELKENPAFILSSLRSILSPYVMIEEGIKRFSKNERALMRAAVRHDRVIRPLKVAKELELHPETIIKYCRKLVKKGKFRAVANGASGRVTSYEYIGSLQSPDLL